MRSILGLSNNQSLSAGRSTNQPENPRGAWGFLGDYSLLEVSNVRQTLLRYKNPRVDWASCKYIKLDPVTIWQEPGVLMFNFGAEDRQKLADKFYGLLYTNLARTHQIVKRSLKKHYVFRSL